jgi:hypothetical protein
MARLVLVALLALALGGVAGGVIGYWLFSEDRTSEHAVSGASLTEAVADEVGTASAKPCQLRSVGRWRCSQWDPGQSGDGRDYNIVIAPNGCWTGEIIGRAMTTEGPMPKVVGGCL